MLDRLKKLMPERERLQQNRWLRWLRPWLGHPRLWHLSRKGVALGMAIGVFFGLLIPVAQIPASAVVSVLLRAHLPAAAASTLVTNPVTFAPVYYAAYELGRVILREEAATEDELARIVERKTQDHAQAGELTLTQQIQQGWRRLGEIGKPLILGLSILAVTLGLAVYFGVSAIWTLRVRLARRQRLRKMRNPD
ncbi:DUF2062 domain-containing protein [Serpentinimonas maccroryi]|uniref:DUF2062 domain-containing protein n=1 Tax=Serpentinimonas maccroryi TaxID=1458426 RepID=UPI002033ECFE|nr:DUF2062 domain-containing protein [Serpentinimonas maccroryi]MCM2479400.1 DUF2062 domain-containing protein [Serpentinimonas maccroryi]